jgi:hypothetical protein
VHYKNYNYKALSVLCDLSIERRHLNSATCRSSQFRLRSSAAC